MSQSLSGVLVHVIFSTKDRFPYLSPSLEQELYPYLKKLGQELNCPILALNGTPDHIHLLCVLSRTITLAKLVEFLKSHSSKWIKTKGNEWVKFQWQNGYGVFSIGQSNKSSLIRYIQDQKEHHKKMSFREEYLRFLELYCIDYDEKYVWG